MCIRDRVWACCKAAVYLYGAADAGQVETICKAVGCEADAGEITSLCREMKGVWTDFAYWDGRFIDWDLVQGDAYKDVLNYQKGKEFYIPSAAQVKEIARTGAVEIKRHIRPLKAFFLAMVGCDEETAQEAASSIHHHVRLGTTPKAVEDIMEHFGDVYKRQYVYVVSMDLEKFFDTVNHSKLIEILDRKSVV